jgi:hypothetical protein
VDHIGIAMVKQRFLGILTAGFILSTSGHTLAQQPSLADRETARSLMDEGDKKRDVGDLKGALKSYEAADAIMKVPTTGLEVARTQVALSQLLEARETLGRILRIPAKSGEPAPFVAARKTADALNNELATRIPSILVVIQNANPGQTPQVSIDNEPIPLAAANVPRRVNPGTHIVLVKAGGLEKKLEVDVVERETKTVPVDVKEKAPEPVKPPPPRPPEPEPAPEPSEANATPKILTFGGFGLAVVGIGVGSITGLMSLTKTNDLKQICKDNACPPDRRAEIDSATGLGNISTIAFIAGGVGLGAGIVGLVLSRSDTQEHPVSTARAKTASPFTPEHVRAVLGPSYVGLAGAF